MRFSLTINGHSVGDYVAEDGISISKEERVSKELTMMDGTKRKKTIDKYIIAVTLLDDMLDSKFTELAGWLATNPATVSFTNLETGLTVSNSQFYVDNFQHGITKTIGGSISLVSGASFTLTQK